MEPGHQDDNKPAKDNNSEAGVQLLWPCRVSGISPYCLGRRLLINDRWYTRTDSIPWQGNTYFIRHLQYNRLITVNDPREPDKKFIRWVVELHQSLPFFALRNEQTGMYMRYDPTTENRICLTSNPKLAIGITPLKNSMGGYAFGCAAPLVERPPDPVLSRSRADELVHTFEFIKVT